MARFSTAVLFAIGLLLLAIVSSSAVAQSVTLVQFTDAHLFDSAAHNTTMGGYEAGLDNGSSLAWAILLVNRLVSSGRSLDFVAFTGDFGLEETDCGNVPRKKPPKRPLTSCSQAVDMAAVFFRALLVKKVFLIPGNNDVPDEDPAKMAVYDAFVKALQVNLQALRLPSNPSPPDVIDLTSRTELINGICILGLNSSTFKNTDIIPGDRAAANFIEQEQMLNGLNTKIQKGQPTIIITHIPNLEDPFRDNGIKKAWNLDPRLAKKWDGIVKQPEVMAVFAGHFHDSRRIIYMHDYSWASKPPERIEGDKTWVAPPLASKFQSNAKPQARGLLVATVSSSGVVSAEPLWFGFAETALPPDKGEKLVEAKAYEQAEEYDKAATAYQQGLSSRDEWVRGQAEAGFQRTVKQAKEPTWKGTVPVRFVLRWWRDLFIGLGIALLALLALRLEFGRWLLRITERLIGRPTMMIVPPQKGHDSAPTDEFRVQLILALQDIQKTLEPLSRSQFLTVGDTKVTAPGTGEELPELKISRVELKALVAWVTAARDLFRRRIRIEVWGSTARVQAYAVQRFGWVEEKHWATPSLGSSADVVEAAQQLAYDILGQEYIR